MVGGASRIAVGVREGDVLAGKREVERVLGPSNVCEGNAADKRNSAYSQANVPGGVAAWRAF